MRKPKAKSIPKSALPAEGEAAKTSGLRRLSAEECQAAYNKARIAGNIIEPVNLRTIWAKQKTAGIQDLLGMIRKVVNSTEIDNPENTADYLARLLEAAVERFENLVQSGAMDDVLPRLTALPVLYSLYAGTGGRQWKRARAVFEDKKVGTKSVSAHRGKDPAAAKDPIWGLLAAESVKVASRAALQLPIMDACKEKAVAVGHVKSTRPRGKFLWQASVYLLADGGVLIWPDWLSACRGLPDSVRDNVEGYQAACRLILKEFFGEPGNKWGDALLKPKTEIGSNRSGKAAARGEAVENAVDAVSRLAL